MRTLKFVTAALVALLLVAPTVHAQQPQVVIGSVDNVAGFSGAVNGTGSAACILVKYRGATVGKPTVEVAAGGDMTLKIAGVADTTTGSASNGIFDLSTPAAADDTWGEVVTKINTQGSNWAAALVSCLASDLTDNTADTLSATDASAPGGVPVLRDATVASASAVFTAQVALLPEDAAANIRFFLSGGPVGAPSGSTKVNPNPFANYQTFVQHIREKITSSGTVALFEVLGVKRTYDSTGKVSEVVRTLYAQTGGATTVEVTLNFHPGPIASAKGETIVVRQSTGTALTVLSINGSGYIVRR